MAYSRSSVGTELAGTGVRGFIYAVMASFNTFAKYAKLWEKTAGGQR